MALELPGIDPNRITLLGGLAQGAGQNASSEERDKSDLSILPNLRGYTR